jgi:oligopeptide/dipeptide ABC transporter ATP-binding protein
MSAAPAMSPVAPGLGEPILSVRGLSVGYETAQGLVNAVSDVTLELRPDELMAVIGESGSGKSTLARGILGLLPPAGRITAGQVEFRGGGRQLDLASARKAELRALRGTGIGFVPQATGGALNPVQRVGAHFKVTLKAHGVGWSDGRARAEQALADAGLPDPKHVMHSYPHELSGGMAQRVVVALASVLAPSVLIADEPTSALDVTVQRRLLDNLSASVRQAHRGAMIITHDVRLADKYCDTVLVMYGGYAVEAGPTAEVLAAPRHAYTKALLAAMPGKQDRGGRRRTNAAPGPQLYGTRQRCPFYDECSDRSDERCADQLPPFAEVAPGHYVRSFYG